MAIFLSTFVNKLDKKGRVSVPALFRSALKDDSGQGIVALKSYSVHAIDVLSVPFIEKLIEQVGCMDMFSPLRQDFAATLFADCELLSFDGEGRITLSSALIAHARIEEKVAFVGCGTHFQIWEPEAFSMSKAAARTKLQQGGLTLPFPHPQRPVGERA